MDARAEAIAARLEGLSPAALAIVRDRMAHKVQERRYALWQPYPWQSCPGEVPAMGAWVLGGGRGVGKTDAGARYVLDHVAGPACDPRIPGGHRVAIIAPTLGDASESAITGPSGLQTHDPRVRLRTSNGGTHVIFPNGSLAKVFGAHTKADIERLRSGGNRCIAEGTLVRTECGERPIEQVRPGDRVWTRNGLRRVLHVWDNGVRDVQNFAFTGGSVWMTPDHKVWTDSGWKEASFVQTNDSICVWESTESPSRTLASSGTPGRTGTTRTRIADCCTGSCGSRNAGPSQQAWMFTTRTMTSKTTASATSFCSLPRNTGLNTPMSVDPTGTAREVSPHGVIAPTAKSGALSAMPNSVRAPWKTRSTAVLSVATEHHDRSANGCAWCARHGSPREATQPRPRVRVAARLSMPTAIATAKVYDLTVEHDHEFFAGGLLVANCLVWLEEAAAMRYLDQVMAHSKMGLRIGPRPHYVVTTTPKPRAEIVKLWNSPKTLLTKGRTLDAYHLPPEMRQELLDEYGGTQLGRQELDGEILTDLKGALVSHSTMDASRVPEAPECNLIAVGFDPNGTGEGDEAGIVAVGRGAADGEAYILADATTRATGREAALAAWALFDDLQADVMVVEKNFGQSWLKQVMQDAWAERHEPDDDPEQEAANAVARQNPPIKYVNSGTGKALRAQPMAMRWEQKRVHIVGTLDRLEDQFATWIPQESSDSPDRVDAVVHAFTYIKGKEKARARVGIPQGSIR